MSTKEKAGGRAVSIDLNISSPVTTYSLSFVYRETILIGTSGSVEKALADIEANLEGLRASASRAEADHRRVLGEIDPDLDELRATQIRVEEAHDQLALAAKRRNALQARQAQLVQEADAKAAEAAWKQVRGIAAKRAKLAEEIDTSIKQACEAFHQLTALSAEMVATAPVPLRLHDTLCAGETLVSAFRNTLVNGGLHRAATPGPSKPTDRDLPAVRDVTERGNAEIAAKREAPRGGQ